MTPSMRRNQRGMTMMEVLVAMLIFTVVFLVALGLYQVANRAYLRTDAATIQQQNVRFAMDRMAETVRDAGANYNTLGANNVAEFLNKNGVTAIFNGSSWSVVPKAGGAGSQVSSTGPITVAVNDAFGLNVIFPVPAGAALDPASLQTFKQVTLSGSGLGLDPDQLTIDASVPALVLADGVTVQYRVSGHLGASGVLMAACAIAKADIWETTKVNLPLIGALLAVLILCTYVPWVSLVLVDWFYGG